MPTSAPTLAQTLPLLAYAEKAAFLGAEKFAHHPVCYAK